MQTAPLDFRLATRADEELLIALMREFYAEDRIDFDDARVRRGVDALLADRATAKCCCGWTRRPVVGYAVIAMGFSLEQGGHFMLLDELYLSHRARGRGRGKQALAICEQRARARRQPPAPGSEPPQRTGPPPVPGERLHR
jgi:GNAT superfamily N-acetyltransferase